MELKKHETLLKELQIKYPTAVLDGAVNSDQWSSQKDKRILWVLKEVNDFADDLRNLLNDVATAPNPNKIYNRWKASYGLVVKVSHGLLNNFSGLSDWANNVDTIKGALKEIAVINVNKETGLNKTSPKKLVEAAERFHEVIFKQVELLDPDIVVLGGVGDALSKWMPSNDTKRKWISVLHPGQRTRTHKQYYDLIVKKLKTYIFETPRRFASLCAIIPHS